MKPSPGLILTPAAATEISAQIGPAFGPSTVETINGVKAFGTLADLEGDGDVDLVTREILAPDSLLGSSTVHVMRNLGGSSHSDETISSPRIDLALDVMRLGGIDGDGLPHVARVSVEPAPRIGGPGHATRLRAHRQWAPGCREMGSQFTVDTTFATRSTPNINLELRDVDQDGSRLPTNSVTGASGVTIFDLPPGSLPEFGSLLTHGLGPLGPADSALEASPDSSGCTCCLQVCRPVSSSQPRSSPWFLRDLSRTGSRSDRQDMSSIEEQGFAMKTKHRLDLLMIVVPLILSAGASAQEGFAFGPPQDQVFMGALSVTSFGDLDGDGDQDLVGVPGLGGVIRLFDNDGSGQFSLTATLQAPGGTPGGGCVPVDLDGDGICEILYRSSFLSFLGGHFETYLGSHIAVYKQVGGVFVRNDYLVGADGPRFLVGDFDGDGDGDLLVGSGTFVPGDGVGGFLPPMTIALPGATTVESVGDIDQDGREDVAWLTNGTPRMLQIGFGRGLPQPGFDVLTVGYLPAIGNFPPAPQQGLLSGDVDGDGLLDVILTFSLPFPSPPTYHAANVVCRQRAPREFRIGPLAEGGLPHGQMSIFNLSADVDGDGRTDLLQYLNLLTPECLFSRGLTGGFLDTPVSVSISLTPNGIRHLVDVNGDGRADVINVFVSTASGTAMSTVTTFESLSVPVLKPLVAEVFGSPTLSGFIGHALPSQPTFRVRQAGGAPAAFEPLQFEVRTEGALTSTIAGQTDAQGFCVLPFPTGPLPSRHDVILRGASFDAVYQNIEVFESSAIIDSMPPIGPPYVALRFERSPSAGPMPLLLCADLPLPPPGFVPTAFGPIYTSLLQPGPAFGALDGVGLYGPADPALRAAPAYTLTSSIAGIQPGFSLVLQFIGFDPVPPYPDGLVLGPGLFLDF